MHTEYLSAWELHAVFKQIIKSKVRGSCGGHSLGYSSECVHYPGRKRAGGGSGQLLFNVGKWPPLVLNTFSSCISKTALGVLRTRWSVNVNMYAHVSQLVCMCTMAHSLHATDNWPRVALPADIP